MSYMSKEVASQGVFKKIKIYLISDLLKPFSYAIYQFLLNSRLKTAFKKVAPKSPFVEGLLRGVNLAFIDFQLHKNFELKKRESNAQISEKFLFIDASLLIKDDFKTGIQRVARSILMQLLNDPPQGYAIKVIYSVQDVGYKLAYADCQGTDNLFLKAAETDEVISIEAGDIFLGLDFTCVPTILEKPYLERLREEGVKVYFVVYDLLPVQFPSYFPPVSNHFHAKWLRTIAQFDGVICISETVAKEYRDWIKKKRIKVNEQFKIAHFHLGSDLSNSSPTKGLPDDAGEVLNRLKAKTTFLIVGTIEPRKGYGQMLDTFTKLWLRGEDVNLVIVGRVGWNIQKLVDKISNHSELGQRLFWLQGISDEYLEKLYEACSCLVAASEAEGFGLPIIEAAQHHIPVIARDIPVFREVAGDAAYYFSDKAKKSIADQFKVWIELKNNNQHPKSDGIQYINWQQSTDQLKKAVFN